MIAVDDGDNITMWYTTEEPMWVYYTQGLGHNHGGTSLSVEQHYNSNIPADRYFRADQKQQAVAAMEAAAVRRGDTNSVPARLYADIEILIPEAVRRNPAAEHGDGDPFLNSLYHISETADSSNTAGLLSLVVLAQNLPE